MQRPIAPSSFFLQRDKRIDSLSLGEGQMRKLVTIGVCAIILGTVCACTQCQTPSDAAVRAGSNSVGFGNRAGAPNYYCQPGVCKKTGWNDPDYRVCPGGFGSKTAAGRSLQLSGG